MVYKNFNKDEFDLSWEALRRTVGRELAVECCPYPYTRPLSKPRLSAQKSRGQKDSLVQAVVEAVYINFQVKWRSWWSPKNGDHHIAPPAWGRVFFAYQAPK